MVAEEFAVLKVHGSYRQLHQHTDQQLSAKQQ